MVILMENSSYSHKIINRRIFLEHLSVVLIFSVLTVIITFPVILDFATMAAGFGCYDPCHMMWRFWWTNFSFENNLNYYHSDYIFYPEGTDIGGNLAYFTTFIGSLLVQFLDYHIAWNVIWFSGLIFGGYGCYLLVNNFNKNYLSSIIAGIVFTFTTYHMAHSLAHIGLSMIVWIPIFVLFLFKLLEKQSKYYPIIGGVIFFLISLTHLHYFVIASMFSIIFFIIYIFKQKTVSNKTFTINFSILFLIGVTSTLILFFATPVSDDNFPIRPLSEHINFSNNLEALILPVPYHTTQILSNDEMSKSFYSFFDQPVIDNPHLESHTFLGYSVIFLSALAIIRYRQNHALFWLLICGIFVVISFGPELKIFGQSTGIEMPVKIFYDTIPEWDEVRSPARFIVMANLALAVLVSYSVYGLIKNKFSSFKQQLMLVGIIGFVILFEFSMIPYPSFTEPIPSVYDEIKNDDSEFVVLAAPIGTSMPDDTHYGMSHPEIMYHQIYHEKPIYAGFESRVTTDTLDETQTYFLNMFRKFSNNDDIVEQDLAIHGLSLFDHFDIKYLTVHKDAALGSPKVKEISRLMSEILNEKRPIYEDNKMIVYKIPEPNSSEPFLLLGSGWHEFNECTEREEKIRYDCNTRSTMKNSEILIVNPTSSEIEIALNIVLSSVENKKTMTIHINNKENNSINIPVIPTNIQIENLILKSGVNVITLDANQLDTTYDDVIEAKIDYMKEIILGFHVKSISITN